MEGNILSMADRVLEILRSKYLVSPIHYQGLQRIEELEYPEDALREAILNAIVHKDYTGAPIQMSVYNDRLILWNSGRLPEDITIEILKQKHPSRPANRNVAELFFKAGYIEVWGRGIGKIFNTCKSAGLPEPVIEEYAGGIQITFLKKENVVENVVENEYLILKLLKGNDQLTAKEIAKKIRISDRTVQRYLKTLQGKNLIKRIGPSKGGHWEIVN